MSDADVIWDPGDTARYLRMSRQSLADMRSRGDGPKYFKLSARAVRYRKSDVDAWIETKAGRGSKPRD